MKIAEKSQQNKAIADWAVSIRYEDIDFMASPGNFPSGCDCNCGKVTNQPRKGKRQASKSDSSQT